MLAISPALAAADAPGENPFAVVDSLTCGGEVVSVAVVGIPEAAPGSEAAGRPGVGIVIGETTRLIPKSLTARIFVNDQFRREVVMSWGSGVTDLESCFQTLEFTTPAGAVVRTELQLEVIVTGQTN